VIAVCAFSSLGGLLFLNTLYLRDVRGYSAPHAGLYLLPMAAIVVCAPRGRPAGAAGEERARKRPPVHDVVAHHLAVVDMQAGATGC